jgi:hypothetical protein
VSNAYSCEYTILAFYRLLQAEAAGVIQTADAMVAAMAAHLDLRDNVNEIRSAGELILRAIANIFVKQADMELRLCSLEQPQRYLARRVERLFMRIEDTRFLPLDAKQVYANMYSFRHANAVELWPG